MNTQKSSEDNADVIFLKHRSFFGVDNFVLQVDEVERSVREVNRLLGDNFAHKTPTASNTKAERSVHIRKSILSVQHRHLNPNNELKRIFGSKIVQSEQ